jgi:hypothetical protein
MKTGVEITEGLRYKLRMMGVPLDGPAHVKVDNMSVVNQEQQHPRVSTEEEEQFHCLSLHPRKGSIRSCGDHV